KWDFNEFIVMGTWRPKKKNLCNNRFIKRMKERNERIPDPGKQFSYVIVKGPHLHDEKGRLIPYRVGDYMKYPSNIGKEQNMKIDINYYLAIEEIRNAPKNIPNAQSIMCKRHRIGAETYKKIINNQRPSIPTEEWRSIVESVSTSDNKNPLLHSREVLSDQNSDDNQKSSHYSSSFSNDSIVLETKKEQVSKIPLSSSLSPIILQDSEDALEVFKKSQNGMEKAMAKGHALEQKLKT
ncbi:6035_t:CDS:2, partial [Funneliformis geosporum]